MFAFEDVLAFRTARQSLWLLRLQKLVSLILYPIVFWYCTFPWNIMSLFGCFSGGPPPVDNSSELGELQLTVARLRQSLAASQAAQQLLKQELQQASPSPAPAPAASAQDPGSNSITSIVREKEDAAAAAVLAKAKEDAATASLQFRMAKEELALLQQQTKGLQAHLTQAEAKSMELRVQLEKAISVAQQSQERAAKEAGRAQVALADKAQTAVQHIQAETELAARLATSEAETVSLQQQLQTQHQQLLEIQQSAFQASTLSSGHLSTLQQQQQQATDLATAVSTSNMQQVMEAHSAQSTSTAAELQAARSALTTHQAASAAQLQATIKACEAEAAAQLQSTIQAYETEVAAQLQAARAADRAEFSAALEAALAARSAETQSSLERAGAGMASQLALQQSVHGQECTQLSEEAAGLREQLAAAQQLLRLRDSEEQSMVAKMAELQAKATAHDMVLDSTADTTSELLRSYQALKAQHTALQADVKVKEEMFELLQQQVQELAGMDLETFTSTGVSSPTPSRTTSGMSSLKTTPTKTPSVSPREALPQTATFAQSMTA